MKPAKPATSPVSSGPFGYQNWKAAELRADREDGREVALYSDSRFESELGAGLGPYEVINAVLFSLAGEAGPVLVLRADICLDGEDAARGSQTALEEGLTKLDEYVGGTMYDEIAALLSLTNGVRLQAGSETRRFNRRTDPIGRPLAPSDPPPIYVPPRFGLRIPDACRTVRLELSRLPSYPHLDPLDAVALARAARSYQEALWVAESDPQLAWLLLVSAIETAAARWFRTSGAKEPTDVEVLRAANADLANLLLEHGGDELLGAVAKAIAQGMRAGYKFREFLGEFMPSPPQPRPRDWAAAVWGGDKKKLDKSLSIIYGHRSKALHESLPFPIPMCARPRRHDEDNGTSWLTERPGGTAGEMGGVWSEGDLPMLLWAFEYLSRNALVKWWDWMASPAAGQSVRAMQPPMGTTHAPTANR